MAQQMDNDESPNDDFNMAEFNIIEVDGNKIVQKQSDKYDGLKIIVEGECFVSLNLDQVREIYPDLLTDSRKPVVNLSILKENLNKLIIPSLKDHDLSNSISTQVKYPKKLKYIRTLTKGDKIGDFEFSLKLNRNLFTITNSGSLLKMIHIPLSAFPKLFRRNQQFCHQTNNTTLLKCVTYSKEERLAVLFNNIERKIKSMQPKKFELQRPKSAMTDFEATLKLYGRNFSTLVPSYIPNSMNMMWKMKLSEEYWRKKIEDRKYAQEKENEIKVNYFRSAHHQTARSTKSLGQMRKDDNPRNFIDELKTKASETSLIRSATIAQIPINHPSVSSVWTILKAVSRFKHNSNKLSVNKVAKSKVHIAKEQKRLSQSHISFNQDKVDNEKKKEDIEFDIETSDKNLTSIELRMRKFLNSLPANSNSDGITSLKRFVVDNRSIPQLGGTILVRHKPCNPLEEHDHIQHHILPRDALTTLQKYRAAKPHPNNHNQI